MSDKNSRYFHSLDFKWLILADTVVVCGSVMSFGLIAVLFLGMQESESLAMIFMIVPMSFAVVASSKITLHFIRKRMNVLLDGIWRVADGDMDVVLETKGADEYAPIYENFNLMVKELKGTKAEMQNFVNEFAHEFKTPITSISGFAQYLAETGGEMESEERLEYLRIIWEESLRLSELSQKTLLLSKVEACQIVTDKSDFSLSEQIKGCAILLLPQMEKKHLNLNVELADITYCWNAELMEQVWINLLNNAVKFTPEYGEISIVGESAPDGIRIHISDSGVGMDEETVRHIFEKYYQNDNLHTVRGNGIGLSIVFRIVTLCGGRIEVTSRPEEGSRFTVFLPKPPEKAG